MSEPSLSCLLSPVLYLIAVHSLIVGLILMVRPKKLMALTDLAEINEPFFPVQGGMFHIIMSVGYALAAYDLQYFYSLVIFAVLVKLIAFCFLLLYYFLGQAKKIVLFSGILDGVMGLVILYFYFSCPNL